MDVLTLARAPFRRTIWLVRRTVPKRYVVLCWVLIPSRICDEEGYSITGNLKTRLLPCKVSHIPSPYSSDPPPSYMPPPSSCPTAYSADPSPQSSPPARPGYWDRSASANRASHLPSPVASADPANSVIRPPLSHRSIFHTHHSNIDAAKGRTLLGQ